MKIEFPALHSEPLVYFLLHSGVFVLIMAVLFFALGCWFGQLTWGKYKLQSKTAAEENNALLGEIATLKRKLAEQSLRPSHTQALVAEAPAALSEKIPAVSVEIPALQSPAPVVGSAIVVTPALVAEVAPPAAFPQASEISSATQTTSEPKTTSPAASDKPIIRAKAKPPEKAMPILDEPMVDLEPFGFLLPEPEPAQKSTGPDQASALDSIIQGKKKAKIPRNAAKTGKTAKVKLPPEPVRAPTPEMDPALGPIYRERPPQADDLTKIKGIAGVLERRLHELGIHTFQQISQWEENHIREFSTRLAFKDRITRERWVDQARLLEQSPPTT